MAFGARSCAHVPREKCPPVSMSWCGMGGTRADMTLRAVSISTVSALVIA